uniref:CUB domain-containing protein n=1 Tax=Acrobeloides nanus TaxID=290746 RepID=A0A914DA41_9BILA
MYRVFKQESSDVNQDICKNQISCQYGGYPNPHDCTKCKCPAGLAGVLCESLPISTFGCGGELFATAVWQTLTNTIEGECFWRINAPTNQRIHFEVLEANFECDSSCAENYLEIKHTDNFQRTGFRQCCNAAPGPIISQQNQVLVFSRSSKPSANFTIRYII